MCKNSENGANSDFQKVMRSSNGTGATHWRHAEGRRQRAEEFYELNVYELIVNCVTVCFFTNATGARSNWHLAGSAECENEGRFRCSQRQSDNVKTCFVCLLARQVKKTQFSAFCFPNSAEAYIN